MLSQISPARPQVRRVVSPEEAVDILLDCGLISTDDILADAFSAQQAQGRNRAVLVRTAKAALLVKPADANEARRETSSDCLRALIRVPTVWRTDSLVVTATPAGLAPIADGHIRGRYDRWVVRALARDLARVHQVTPPPGTALAGRLPFRSEGAPIRTLNESGAVRALLAQAYDDTELCRAVAELGAQPLHGAFIHGDIRAANILCGIGTGRSTLWWIDWELSGRGDPMEDMGAAIAVVLSLSLRRSRDGPDRAAAQLLVRQYEEHGPAVNVKRMLQRAGAALMQAALEDSACSHSLSSFARRAYDIGRMGLVTPELLAVHLRLA